MPAQHPEKSSDALKGDIWIRSGGRCECASACEHHERGRCGNVLLPGFWSVRDILPTWAWTHKGLSMREASCEACRINPAVQDHQLSEDSKRASPNWWYQRPNLNLG